jgi:hypothetical protein
LGVFLNSNWGFIIKRKIMCRRRLKFIYNYGFIDVSKTSFLLNQQNPLFLPIIAYTLSTTKLEIRAK